jgi:hypothetical protein
MLDKMQLDACKGYSEKSSKRNKKGALFYPMLLFEALQILLPFRQVLFRPKHFLRLVV